MIDPELVLRSLPDALVVTDGRGVVRGWSRAAEAMFGLIEQEAVGRSLTELGLPAGITGFRSEQRIPLRRPSGEELQVVVTASSLPAGQTALLLRDLEPWLGPASPVRPGGRDSIDEMLGMLLRGTMQATGADFDPGEGIDSLAQRLALQGTGVLPGSECGVALVPLNDRQAFRIAGGAGELAARLLGRRIRPQGALIGRAGETGRVMESTRVVEEYPESPIAAAGYETARAVPMLARQPLPDGRRELGVVWFMRRESKPYSETERRLIDDFARLATVSLQRAEFRIAAERSSERLQFAVDAAVDLAQSLEPAEVVRRLVRLAHAAARADRSVLLRLEGGETVVEAAHDVDGHDDLLGFRQPVSAQPLMQEAIRTRQVVIGGPYDVAALPSPLRESLALVTHTITVPLILGGEAMAVLVLSRRGDLHFGPAEIDTLRLLASVAVLTLRNAWLFAETQEAARLKSDFLNMAAHELRTPLTVISGYLSLLREGSFGRAPASWHGPLNVLASMTTELLRLVEDLLLAARLETGRLPSLMESIDLRDLVRLAAQPFAAATVLELPETPVMIRGDRDQIGRLLGQLVTNALAYDRPGEPPWVRLAAEAPANRVVRLVVEDRGRGVPEAERERIFERFYRVEDREHPVQPGTGLGLYIARSLAERHGGSLELEWSEVGVGSRFVLRLPAAG